MTDRRDGHYPFLAQSVERRAEDSGVGGSNPSERAINLQYLSAKENLSKGNKFIIK